MLRREFVWKDNYGCRVFHSAYPESFSQTDTSVARDDGISSLVMFVHLHYKVFQTFASEFPNMIELSISFNDPHDSQKSLFYSTSEFSNCIH